MKSLENLLRFLTQVHELCLTTKVKASTSNVARFQPVKVFLRKAEDLHALAEVSERISQNMVAMSPVFKKKAINC